MAGTPAPQRALDDIERLALRAQSRAVLFDEAAARLRRAVPFDGACWHTLDPGSGLITQHRLQMPGIPDDFPTLARNEYLADDVNRFTELASGAAQASTLHRATQGRPERSPRFRHFLAPRGIGAELRAAFVADGTCWGALILIRAAGAPDFADHEVELIGRLSPVLARAVRRGLVAEAVEQELVRADAPGLVEFGPGGEVTGCSSTAEPLLAELSGTTSEEGLRAPALHAVASRAHREPRAAPVKTPSGSWLVLHGTLLSGAGPARAGVFIQRAHPTVVAPLLLKAYGLTPREEEISQLVLRGAQTAQIARRLSISPYTVSDHLKRIFEKTGARSRGELSAQLFFDQHLPRIESRTAVGDDASFADAPRPRGRLDEE